MAVARCPSRRLACVANNRNPLRPNRPGHAACRGNSAWPHRPKPKLPTDAAPALDFDAIIIGAGMSGMYQLHRLRQQGMRVRVFEAGTGVGGTWYWNRYPGARFDSESYSYGYSFSPELLEEWNWSEHFAGQPETLRYLNHVADKFDLRRDIQFRSQVTAAIWAEDTRSWTITLQDGSSFRARFLITAIGPLSAPTLPRIEGVDSFKGQSFHTARWPHEPVDFTGKRVAVIGTGATGVQTIQTIAGSVGHLTVFQRTPNWCAPLHNGKIDAETQNRIKAGYPEMFRRCQETFACFIHTPDPRGTFEVTERRARGVLREIVLRARFRHLAGQFSRYPDRPEGQRADQRFRGAQDSPAGEGSKNRGETDSRGITASAPGGCRWRPSITRSTTGTMSRWSTSRKRRSSGSRPRVSRPATGNTNSTSSSTPPASTPSPAVLTRSISAGSTARG